jgi:hypothetical protein
MNIIKSITHRVKPIFEEIYLHIFTLGKMDIFTKHKNSPRVTIFGCCRQDSIYNHFSVTAVRNGLTYPHYSKEVIQAIKYCKFEDFSVPEWAFRNPQINLKVNSKKSLMREFKRTDVFVVEIASRLEYIYQDVYLHHEMYDNANHKKRYGWPERDLIEVREQSWEELHQDLLRIVELLDGKKIIFACHISTREYSSRATLVSEILNFCKQHQIECFVPSELLNFYEQSDVFIDEKVLSHFTDFGHRIAGYRYREMIETNHHEVRSNFNPLIQTLEKPSAQRREFSSGFGDFLNGSLKVYEMAKRLKRLPKIDFSQSNFAHHLENRYVHREMTTVNPIYHEDSSLKFIKSTRVFTNKVSQAFLEEDSRDFIYRNCLTPKATLKMKIEDATKNLKLKAKCYDVLHIRVSDDFDVNPDTELLAKLQKVVQSKDLGEENPLFLLSNSNLVRSHFKGKGFVSPDQKIYHSSDPSASVESIENTLVEFFLISKANKIYQISTYEWGSGFSTLASKLFDVPLERIVLS